LDDNLKETIKTTLMNLLNQRMRKIGRSGNMLWLCFGDDVNYVNYMGNLVTKPKYALHIQCNWEIIKGNEIITSCEDFYISNELIAELTDVEMFGNSKFDKISDNFNVAIETNPIHVINFSADKEGGFELELSNNHMIKVYPFSPADGESWRFLMPGSDEEHFVIFDN